MNVLGLRFSNWGVAILFRVAKYFSRAGKVFLSLYFTLDSLKFVVIF